ncbi:MAG: hypothetical protein ACI3XW_10620, partial [Butyricicoccus sp.]
FIYNQSTSLLADKIVGLLPDQLLQLNSVLCRFSLYSIGGTVVGSISILFVLYTVLTLVLQPVLYTVFRKKEVR